MKLKLIDILNVIREEIEHNQRLLNRRDNYEDLYRYASIELRIVIHKIYLLANIEEKED